MVTTPTNDPQFVALSLVVKVREKCAASPTSLYNIALRGLSPANVTPISQCLDAVAHGGNPRRSALHRFYKTRAIMEADSRNYYLEKLLVIKPPILH
ncbi:MAG: hypothetical protein F6K56_04535 [Moorea sp. SIO3G5]|nr:hypothetical protein [Moorena sp. SIO3G5]